MRAGILVLGPLISKYHKSITSLPGGCLIGARPVNYHLNALKKLGMKYEIKKGYIHASCLLYTSPSPRDRQKSRMPSSA